MNSIINVLDQYKKAVETKDVDLMLSLYSDNVHMYDCWEDWSYEGKDRVKEMIVNWFDSIDEGETVGVEFMNSQYETSDTVAFVYCDVKFSGINAENVAYKSVTNRFTFCLVYDEKWLIQHQHSSLPTE